MIVVGTAVVLLVLAVVVGSMLKTSGAGQNPGESEGAAASRHDKYVWLRKYGKLNETQRRHVDWCEFVGESVDSSELRALKDDQ